jgi:trimethylamine--corrinoid protein Co-methyltransferase
MVSDWRNYESWKADGSKDATQRATAIWQQALERYQQPALDPAAKEALEEHVAKRKEVLKSVDH